MKHLRAFSLVFGLACAAILLTVFAAWPAQAAEPAAGQVPQGCGFAWNYVASPNATTTDNALTGTAGIASNDVWAVGFYTGTNGIAQTLTEHWNGSAWSITPSANAGTADNYLQAAAATAPNNVWAVGYYKNGANFSTLIEQWNGTAWAVVPSPNQASGDNFLYGVSASSATDAWAVGLFTSGTLTYRPIVLHWNGTAWSASSITAPGLGGGLRGVVSINSTTAWAVGAYADFSLNYRTWAARWNGTSWSTVTSPNQGSGGNLLAGVSAVSATDVWAVGVASSGTAYQTLTEHWNGTAWSIVPGPSFGTGDNGLSGVLALAANDVWAVGGYSTSSGSSTLALHWDGTAWSQQPSDSPGSTSNELLAVTKAGTDLWAVGQFSAGGPSQTLTEFYGAAPCVTPTETATSQATATATNTAVSSATATSTALSSVTAVATATSTAQTSATATRTTVATATAMVTTTPCVITFTDVLPTDYFYEPVRYLYCEGAISGYADNTFRPYNNTTRGQLSKIVVIAEHWTIENPPTGHFTDVAPGSTFYVYIETAYAHNVISGYSDGTFRPFNNVTRGQLSKIMVVAQGWTIDTSGGPHFTDVGTTNAFYGYVETAYHHGIISGYADGTFRPGANATRGQIAKIVYNSVTNP